MRSNPFDQLKPTDDSAIETHEKKRVDEIAAADQVATVSSGSTGTPSKYRVIPTTTFGSFEGPR